MIGANEGWGAMDTLYYAVVTSTTIGYGDLHPTKRGSYWMAIIYIPSAVIAVGDAISNLVGYAVSFPTRDRLDVHWQLSIYSVG